MLLGRAEERATIDRLLADARAGRSGVLVLRGEPGVGKTTLLRYAADSAETMTVLRSTGVESEAELEFSGLHELCRPLLDRLELLPPHQAAALGGALGLGETRERDRFAVGVALLGLLAQAADDRPLLAIVDDAHWLDRASIETLCFAVRRLLADRVAVLFAARSEVASAVDTAGFEELALGGLDPQEAAQVLEQSASRAIRPEVASRLHAATGGNPLALEELPALLTPGQLDGREAIADPLPAGASVRGAYLRRANELPEETRLALVVVAALPSGEVDVVTRALAALGLDVTALEPAEDVSLVYVDAGRIRFAHPLVRSAVYDGAPGSVRRSAHRALADVLMRPGEEDRRARHLAAATVEPDDAVAEILAAAAERAAERGAGAAAAAAFERAARLTVDPGTRLVRLERAARNALAGADRKHAESLIREALSGSDDPRLQASLLLLSGRIEAMAGTQAAAVAHLTDAAELAADVAPEIAGRALAMAAQASLFAGDVEAAVGTARRSRSLAPRDGSLADRFADHALGEMLAFSGRFDEAVPLLEQAIDAVRHEAVAEEEVSRAALALALLDRVADADALAEQACRSARPKSPRLLAYALEPVSWSNLRAGRWQRTTVAATEGLALAREMGQHALAANFAVELATIEAARGDEPACLALLAEAHGIAEPRGLRLLTVWALHVEALLDLGLGRLDQAVPRLAKVADTISEMGLFSRDIAPEPELVELYVRLGQESEARTFHERWLTRGPRTAPYWGAALAARTAGILAADDEFEDAFTEALALHEQAEDAFAAARTRLCFGERLRRAARRTEARLELRAAIEAFEELEAEPWAERARRELRATGEKLRRRRIVPGEELTPQELQIALQVAEGKTNKEVAAALFLSPKTIEFHLARVYRKLSIRSRSELAKNMARTPAPVL